MLERSAVAMLCNQGHGLTSSSFLGFVLFRLERRQKVSFTSRIALGMMFTKW